MFLAVPADDKGKRCVGKVLLDRTALHLQLRQSPQESARCSRYISVFHASTPYRDMDLTIRVEDIVSYSPRISGYLGGDGIVSELIQILLA